MEEIIKVFEKFLLFPKKFYDMEDLFQKVFSMAFIQRFDPNLLDSDEFARVVNDGSLDSRFCFIFAESNINFVRKLNHISDFLHQIFMEEAIEQNNHDIVLYLLNNGYDPMQPIHRYHTLLSCTIESLNIQLLEKIINYYTNEQLNEVFSFIIANPNRRNEYIEVAEIFFKNGFILNNAFDIMILTDNDSENYMLIILKMARKYGNPVDLFVRNNKGQTVIDIIMDNKEMHADNLKALYDYDIPE